MTQIHIDSQQGRISLELELRGEPTPIRIDIEGYRIVSDAGQTYIEVESVRTSREWMTLAAADYFKAGPRRFQVPGVVKALL